MCIFLKSLDMKVWRSILIGWCPPTKIDDDGIIVVNTRSEWISKEDKSSTSNWMALNAIKYGVDFRQLSLIDLLNRQRKLGAL